MTNPVYSAVRRRRLYVEDTSSDENTPPNVMSCIYESEIASSSDSTFVAPSWAPDLKKPESESMRNASSTDEPPHPTPPTPRQYRSPTMSSPVLLETPQSSLHRPKPTRKLDSRRTGRCVRRDAAAPYTRTRSANSGDRRRSKSHASPELEKLHSFLRAAQPDDVFVPAQWPWDVAHLREMYNPLATIFPAVQHHGWCDRSSPCRADSCRNSLMHIYCNVNSCPYEGLCGNGLVESDKVFLGKNARTQILGVVAAEDIGPGEVLSQYLGEIEHLSALCSGRPRNQGFRLVLTQRPERPSRPIRAAINAGKMGSLMRFVNHSCSPVAKFVEVSNGRRTTVVVVTTHVVRRGQEVTVDYGDDLWFICRCGLASCRHRDIQDEDDP